LTQLSSDPRTHDTAPLFNAREAAANEKALKRASGDPVLYSLLEAALSVRPTHNLVLLSDAYHFAERTYRTVVRRSGKPLIEHALAVARILIDINLGSTTVAAGLLHEAVDEKTRPLPSLREEFGDEIASLVEGVGKIKDNVFQAPQETRAEHFRTILLTLAEDLRVVLIKFADRLHNLQNLEELDPETQHRMAIESRDIYAPLAHRLGIARIRWEMEDLSLKWIEPEAYASIREKIFLKRQEREAFIEEVRKPILSAVTATGIDVSIAGRPKNFFSIHKKMQRRAIGFEEIHDLLALRIIVGSVQECYTVLGIVHSVYTPVMARFKDFIATPKANRYQSLHTTIISPQNVMVEVQIRTWDMHQTSEVGIAAHWRYKEGGDKPTELDEHMPWLRGLLEWERETTDPLEFMEDLRIDLFPDEIYVLTPDGDPIQLPLDATPIDFAFAIHTDLGLKCAAARVDGRSVPLHTPLRTGSRVEVIPSDRARPEPQWLDFVQSRKARAQIRRFLRDSQTEAAWPRSISVEIQGADRDGLLMDITRAVSALNISIIEGRVSTRDGQIGDRFVVSIPDRSAYDTLFGELGAIAGIEKVQDVTGAPV
jgi:guanosine-3',5'-bis(diphosphate) 3'-pyrophosphohydrolase